MAEGERGSIAFDRAVEFYDRTRALPPDVHTAAIDVLLRELGGRGRALEIGVGTGRIALSLASAGVELVGVDLSRPMLERLVANAGGTPPFGLAIADATGLPFPSGRFGAALASHVLHLIPRWSAALAELARVTRPGGVLLVTRGGGVSDTAREVSDRFFAEAGTVREVVGADTIEEVDDAARALGLSARTLGRVTWRTTLRLGELVDQHESNLFSSTWSLDDAARARAAVATRRWLAERFGAADTSIDVEASVVWRAYDVP